MKMESPTYNVRGGCVYRGSLHIFEAHGEDANERAGEYARWIASNAIAGDFPDSFKEARRKKTQEFFAAHPEKSKFPVRASVKWILEQE